MFVINKTLSSTLIRNTKRFSIQVYAKFIKTPEYPTYNFNVKLGYRTGLQLQFPVPIIFWIITPVKVVVL